MSLRATATGMLTESLQERMANGVRYIVAIMKAPTSKASGVRLCVASFKRDVADALADLKKGDIVTVEGAVKEYTAMTKGAVRYLWDLRVEKSAHRGEQCSAEVKQPQP